MFSTHKARAYVIFDKPRRRPHTAAPAVSRVGAEASGMGGPVRVFPVPGGCGGAGMPRPTPRGRAGTLVTCQGGWLLQVLYMFRRSVAELRVSECELCNTRRVLPVPGC